MRKSYHPMCAWTLQSPLILSMLLCLWSPAAMSQEPAEQGSMERIGGLGFKEFMELTLVNIDVFVRDDDGNPVEGLTVDDFRVLQDGEPKEISNFATYDEKVFKQQLAMPELPEEAQPEPETAVELEQPEPQRIYIVIYIDNENLRIHDRNRVLTYVRNFVQDTAGPNVEMMVVSYQRSLKVLQHFTSDTTAINDAIRSVRKAVGGRNERNTVRSRILRDINRMYEKRSNATSTSGYDYNSLYEQVRSYADEMANNLDFTLRSIREVGEMMAGLQGRKYLIYISNGIPLVPGKDLLYEFANINLEAPVLSLAAPYNRKYRYDALVAAANAQGMTFHTIDATGTSMATEISAEYSTTSTGTAPFIQLENNQQSLQLMAEKTGGVAIVNTNNFADGLAKIKADLFTYYSLGYTINAAGSDKVHRIEVELPGYPKYQLRYRRTFVEKSLESQVQDQVMSGLMFELRDNPMDIDASTGKPAPTSEDRWVLPISVSFPMRSVALTPVNEVDYVGNVVLFVAARDSKGKQSDIQRQVHELKVPKQDYETRQDDKFVIDVQLLMEPGSYEISIGLLDQTTRQSSYTSLHETIRDSS